jgi:anti-sigma B factor antagonist
LISVHSNPQCNIWLAYNAPDRATVHVSGEIDIATAPQLTAALEEAVGNDRDITVDLSGVSFLGMSGVNVLLTAKHDAERRGRTLRVAQARDLTRQVLELNGLASVLLPAAGGLSNERTSHARSRAVH